MPKEPTCGKCGTTLCVRGVATIERGVIDEWSVCPQCVPQAQDIRGQAILANLATMRGLTWVPKWEEQHGIEAW